MANMKKQLRYQLPRTPLKVLRGEKDEEDIRDKYHERFYAPGTSTEDAEDCRDIDDESRRSSLSRDYIMTDIDEVSEEGDARYLGRDTSSIESIDNDSHKNQGDPNNVHNALKHDPNGSVHLQSVDSDNKNDKDDDSNSFSNRNSLPRDEVSETDDDNDDNTDVYSTTSSLRQDDTGDISENNINDSDNTSRGEDRYLQGDDIDVNTGYQTTVSVDEEAIELQVMAGAHEPPNTDTDKEDELSSNDSYDV